MNYRDELGRAAWNAFIPESLVIPWDDMPEGTKDLAINEGVAVAAKVLRDLIATAESKAEPYLGVFTRHDLHNWAKEHGIDLEGSGQRPVGSPDGAGAAADGGGAGEP